MSRRWTRQRIPEVLIALAFAKWMWNRDNDITRRRIMSVITQTSQATQLLHHCSTAAYQHWSELQLPEADAMVDKLITKRTFTLMHPHIWQPNDIFRAPTQWKEGRGLRSQRTPKQTPAHGWTRNMNKNGSNTVFLRMEKSLTLQPSRPDRRASAISQQSYLQKFMDRES